MLTDGAVVRQFSEREFQSLGAATEKRRAAVSKLCGRTDRNFCVPQANFTSQCFMEPELLPVEVLHCGNRDFFYLF